MRHFLKEYCVEIIAFSLALLGVFLMVEQFDIRKSVWEWLQQFGAQLKVFAGNAQGNLEAYLKEITLSDFVGAVLVILTAMFILWRIRYRVLRSEHWRSMVCPRCGGPLVRTHRSAWDRFLTWAFLPGGRRYSCKDRSCKWSGLRHRKHHSSPLLIDGMVPRGGASDGDFEETDSQ